MKTTLFQLTARIADKVNDILDAVFDRYDTETIDGLYAELDALYETRSEKLESYVHVVKNAEAAAKACKDEANAFYAKSKAYENLSRRLKDTLLHDLKHHGEKSATAGSFKIARQKSPPRVVVRIPASDLPTEYQRVTIEADKTALKHALKANGGIDGVQLEDSEHIRIRVK